MFYYVPKDEINRCGGAVIRALAVGGPGLKSLAIPKTLKMVFSDIHLAFNTKEMM